MNVVGSSIAREADKVFYTLAGPEISVATTKAYSTQLIAAYVLAIQFAKTREEISEEQYEAYIEELQKIPEKSKGLLKIKKGFSGLPQNRPTPEMSFSSEEGSTMPSVWKAA